MNESDTIKLLRECDAGAKMAVSSIDEVLEKVSGPGLKQLLQESREHHEKLENEIGISVWTVDEEELQRKFLRKHVDNITTRRLKQLITIRNEERL